MRSIILAAVMLVAVSNTVWAQCSATAGLSFRSDYRDTYKDEDGQSTSEFEARIAPLSFGACLGSNDVTIEGSGWVSNTFATQNPGGWAFAKNSTGRAFGLTGLVAKRLGSVAKAYVGIDHNYIDHEILVFTGNVRGVAQYKRTQAESSWTSPIVGLSLDNTGQSNWIFKGNLGVPFLIYQRDNDSSNANGLDTSSIGIVLSADVGYQFSEHFALLFGTSYRQQNTTYEGTGRAASRTTRWRDSVVVKLQIF